MRSWLLCALLLVQSCASSSWIDVPEIPMEVPNSRGPELHITGKIEYATLEGGFYFLIATNGTRYTPFNLPKEFKRDGLKVEAILVERSDLVSFIGAGRYSELIRIRRL